MIRKKKVLVTSGGTQEYIDDVRVMTNISSGKLGSIIAQKLYDVGASVYYLAGKHCLFPDCFSCINFTRVVTAQDAYEAMKDLVPKMDAVIHCMAVSDFTFKRNAVKCKSTDPMAFIEYMRQNIVPNPKIISQIKIWNPKTILVGFKFEVGMSTEELLEAAKRTLEKNKCNLVVANDKDEMKRKNEHIGHFVYAEPLPYPPLEVMGKSAIAESVVTFLDAKIV